MKTYDLTAAVSIIKKFEGCRLTAYPDPASGGDPWTIGYGATGPNIKPGVTWTQDEAEQDLAVRIARIAYQIVQDLTVSLTDNQFCACVSLAYNIGHANFASSTLLKLLNRSQFEAASKEFLRWDRAQGRVISGLTQRRQAESELFKS